MKAKLNSSRLYIEELTVFIIERIPILKDSSKEKPPRVSKNEIKNNDNINISIERKYFSISVLKTKLLIKGNLFLNIWLGLEWDNNSFIENLRSEKTFINLKPELVEKNDPPTIVKIKKIKYIFDGILLKEKPIFDILLAIEKSIKEKLLSNLKKIKKINTRPIK